MMSSITSSQRQELALTCANILACLIQNTNFRLISEDIRVSQTMLQFYSEYSLGDMIMLIVGNRFALIPAYYVKKEYRSQQSIFKSLASVHKNFRVLIKQYRNDATVDLVIEDAYKLSLVWQTSKAVY